MIRTLSAALAAVLLALPAAAADLVVSGAYALSSNPRTAAAFMTIENHGDGDDRLVAARSDIAARTELHTHMMEDGIARMREIDSIAAPAHGEARLLRGGDHVMFIGLEAPLADGDRFPLTLAFESGAEITVEVVVDNGRGGPMGHGAKDGGGHGGRHDGGGHMGEQAD